MTEDDYDITKIEEAHMQAANGYGWNMKQPRDPKTGRFLSWDGTRNRKFTIDDVKTAYIAGLNNQSLFTLPSKKWEQYKKILGEL